MLLPDNINPEQSIYYNGAFVLKTLRNIKKANLLELYYETKNVREMSLPIFVLCLDWLFLLELINLNSRGEIELCTLNR